MRSIYSGFFSNEVSRNPWVWAALALCTLLLIAAVYTPGISSVMHLVDPGYKGWLIVAILSFFPLVAGQLFKLIAYLRKKGRKN
jgi:Ca2+-transporting ATPase